MSLCSASTAAALDMPPSGPCSASAPATPPLSYKILIASEAKASALNGYYFGRLS